MTDLIPTAIIREQAKTHPSFYLYEESVIRAEAGRLKAHFPGVTFLFSMKTNPHPQVLTTVLSEGLGLDAAGFNEAMAGHTHGLPAGLIQYSAPGKTREEIAAALSFATLIADSPREIQLIQEEAARQGQIARIGIRINPDFTFYEDIGAPSKFGIDEEIVFAKLPAWKALPNVQIVGIHVHSHSQELDTGILCHYYENMFRLAGRVQKALGTPLAFINFGSGIGITFAESDTAVDLARLSGCFNRLAADFAAVHPDTRLFIETGRFVVGKSGHYVTTVADKKVSRGKTFLILAKTMNGFLRPSLIPFVKKLVPDTQPEANEPLYTKYDAFPFQFVKADGPALQPDEAPCEIATLVGSLCTAQDVIAEDMQVPVLEPGDLVVMANAGCYAAALTPFQFASHTPPAELFLTMEGEVR